MAVMFGHVLIGDQMLSLVEHECTEIKDVQRYIYSKLLNKDLGL